MSIRLRNDVARAALPHFLEPLRDLLDPAETGELSAYYYETLMATLEAFERETEKERRRLHPLAPSEN